MELIVDGRAPKLELEETAKHGPWIRIAGRARAESHEGLSRGCVRVMRVYDRGM